MPSPIRRCSSYWKGSVRVALDYGRQLYLLIYIYIYMDTTAAWKKNYFILSDRSGFHMTDSLSIAVHAFAQANTTIWRHHMDADEVYEEKA